MPEELICYVGADGVLRLLPTPIYVPDPEGFMTAVGILLENAKERGAPPHLALPIAAIELALTEEPETGEDEN
jgi:hypothetical protein